MRSIRKKETQQCCTALSELQESAKVLLGDLNFSNHEMILQVVATLENYFYRSDKSLGVEKKFYVT